MPLQFSPSNRSQPHCPHRSFRVEVFRSLQCVPKPPPPPSPPAALRPHCPHSMPSPFKVGYTALPPNLSAHSPHCPHRPDLGHTVSVLRSQPSRLSPSPPSPARIHHRIMPSWSWNYRNCWQRTGPAINTHEEVSTLLIPILFFLVTSPDYFQHLLPSLDSHLSAVGVGGTGASP